MKKHLMIFLFLFIFSFHSHAALENEQDKKVVQYFIDAVKKNDPAFLSTLVQYPLKRPHPLPDIQSPQDFIQKYDMLLGDKEARIALSSAPLDDWSHVGWRGIMFGNGELWLDEEGKLIALNAMSKKEQALRAELLKKDGENLHPSLRSFDTSIVILETKKGRIRIDQIGQTYRYAFWPTGKQMSQKPELVLSKGTVQYEGSGGNHHYDFVNGKHKYVCSITYVGSNSTPPADLEIFKNNQSISYQPARIVK